MSSGWLAVDRCGHVAHFDAGVSGAIPREAPKSRPKILVEETPPDRALFVSEVVYELEGRLLPGLEAGADELHGARDSNGVPGVVFVTSASLLAGEIARHEAIKVRSTLGTAVVFERLPVKTLRRLHEIGACVACFLEPPEAFVEPAQYGIFSYVHLCDSWVAGPYGMRARPAIPVRVQDLPSMRELQRARRIESLCFGQTRHLQPLDHARCHSSAPAYLEVDGKTVRPIPGRENEYRQFFLPRHRRDPRFLIESNE
jgi:hypothetical protein